MRCKVSSITWLIGILTVLLGGIVHAEPNMIYVPDNYPTIQGAVDAANSGDTIVVRDGTYIENVDVNKLNLTITSENGADTTVVQAANPDDHVFNVKSDYVNISGFTVQGSTGTEKAGICLWGSGDDNVEYCYISNNKISEPGYECYHGILLVYASNNTLTDNRISYPWVYGISVGYTGSNILTNNTVTGCSTGIFLYSSNNNNMTGNNTSNENVGIDLRFSDNNILANNIATKNRSGIYLGGSNSNTLINNNASNNYVHGLDISSSSNNNTLIGNTANWNSYNGIDIVYSANNIITNNEANLNGWFGIRFYRSSNNKIYHNNFINNYYKPQALAYEGYGNLFDNGYPSGGNYWSDYTGVDLYSGSDQNQPGTDLIGDTPYVFEGGQDSYPLMMPFENYELGGEEPPEPFTFIHMTDVHIGAWGAEERFADALYEINHMDPKPDFILNTGDIVDEAAAFGFIDLGHYNRYFEALDSYPEIKAKVYAVPGNHDRYAFDSDLSFYNEYVNSTRPANTSNLLPPHDYTFEHKGFTFIGLDSGADFIHDWRRGDGLSPEQMAALRDATKINPSAAKIIFMHHPAIDKEDRIIAHNQDEFISYCVDKNVQLVLTGHTHEDHVFNAYDDDELTYPPRCYGKDYPLFIQTPSASKGDYGDDFPHGYRVIYVKEGAACPLPYHPTASHPKVVASLWSPANLHVYDALGRHTGVDGFGESERNIPYSFYFSHYVATADDGSVIETLPEKIIVFDPCDDYLYEVVGKDEGNYLLNVSSVQDGNTIIFEANEIPTLPNAVHQYNIDWETLSLGEEGVILGIDNDGDGIFEQTVISDNDLSHDEFILQTETVIDFDPDTLNVKSEGEFVTVYIELPEGFDVSEIDISRLTLNDSVAALPKPIEIGDYDSDGIADLMVKFDRQQLIGLLEAGEQVIALTGQLTDGTPLAGIDTIRVIH